MASLIPSPSSAPAPTISTTPAQEESDTPTQVVAGVGLVSTNARTGSMWCAPNPSESNTLVRSILCGVVGNFPLGVRREMLKVIIPHLLENPTNSSYVASRGHMRYLMETVGECFALPLEDYQLIEGGLALYRAWFVTNVPEAVSNDIDAFLCDMVRHICHVFVFRDARGPLLQTHTAISKRALEVFTQSQRREVVSSGSTWVTMVGVLLKSCQTLVACDACDESQGENYAGIMAPHLMNLTLELLLRSNIQEESYWDTFRNIFLKWRHRDEAVKNVCYVTELLAEGCLRVHYNVKIVPPTQRERPESFRASDFGLALKYVQLRENSLCSDNERSTSESSNSGLPPPLSMPRATTKMDDLHNTTHAIRVVPDDQMSTVLLDTNQLHFFWRKMMSMAGDVLDVSTPRSFNIFAASALNIANMCLQVRNLLSRRLSTHSQATATKPPDGLTIFNLLGPFLFRAAMTPSDQSGISIGRSRVFAALCQIFCETRRGSRTISPPPRHAFVKTLHTALMQRTAVNQLIAATIIWNAQPLFSVLCEESVILAPCLSFHLDDILSRGSSSLPEGCAPEMKWCDMRSHAVTLLGSMIGLGSAFRDLPLDFSDTPDSQFVMPLRTPDSDSNLNLKQPRDAKANRNALSSRLFNRSRPVIEGRGKHIQGLLTFLASRPVPYDKAQALLWECCFILTRALCEEETPSNQEKIIWTMVAVAFEDTHNTGIVISVIRALQFLVLHREKSFSLPVCTVAVHALLVLLHHKDAPSDPNASNLLVESLTSFITTLLTDKQLQEATDQFQALVSASFACLADAITLLNVRVTRKVVTLFVTSIVSRRDSFSEGTTTFMPVTSTARIALLRILNPLPFSGSNVPTSLPTMYVACRSTNAILALTDLGEAGDGVRIVVRDSVGAFTFIASPVWEDAAQAQLRAQGAQNKFSSDTQPTTSMPRDTSEIPPPLQQRCSEIQKMFDEEMARLEQETEANQLKQRAQAYDQAVAQQVLSKNILPQPAKPAPAPDRYGAAKGGARNHLSRLFLSTVGGMATCIGAKDLTLLDSTNPGFFTQLHVLDTESDFRSSFHIGVSTDSTPSPAYQSFYDSLGSIDADSGELRWENRRFRLIFNNRAITRAAVDDVRLKWFENLPLDEDMLSDSAHITIHAMKHGLFLVRISPKLVEQGYGGPLLDRMIVSGSSLLCLLRWTCIHISIRQKHLTFAPDCAQPNRSHAIASMIREFKTERSSLYTMIPS